MINLACFPPKPKPSLNSVFESTASLQTFLATGHVMFEAKWMDICFYSHCMQPLNIITITMQMELTTFYIVMFYILQRFSFLGFWIIFVVDEMLSIALQFSPRRTRSVHQHIMIQLCSHCESLSLIWSMTLQYSVLAEHVLYINIL